MLGIKREAVEKLPLFYLKKFMHLEKLFAIRGCYNIKR